MNYFNLTKDSYKKKRKEFKNLYVAKRIKDSYYLCFLFGLASGIDFLVDTYINNNFDFIAVILLVFFMVGEIFFEREYECLFRDYVNGAANEK